MNEPVGQLLRATREAKGQTLEDIERVTRIRARHLTAIEAGDFEALPSPAQARGFLRNYAQHLGLDPDEVIERFEAGQGRRVRRPAPPPPPPPPRRPSARAPAADAAESLAPEAAPQQVVQTRRPRLLTADLLVAVLISLVLVALLVWGGSQLATGVLATGTPTAPPLGSGTAPAATAPPALGPTATPVGTPTPAITYSGVNLQVRAEQRTWVSVKVDGVDQYAGLMPPGETREFIGQSVVEVVTGNGLGTRIIWNGQDQGVLGDYGEVVIRLWTLDGMLTPTPTVAPTAEG